MADDDDELEEEEEDDDEDELDDLKRSLKDALVRSLGLLRQSADQFLDGKHVSSPKDRAKVIRLVRHVEEDDGPVNTDTVALHKRMENLGRLYDHLSNIQQSMHEMNKSIINNIRG